MVDTSRPATTERRRPSARVLGRPWLRACSADRLVMSIAVLASDALDDQGRGYPRPQLQRRTWYSLNGTWEFACDVDGTRARASAVEWTERITVPFAPEAPASGIGRTGFFRVLVSPRRRTATEFARRAVAAPFRRRRLQRHRLGQRRVRRHSRRRQHAVHLRHHRVGRRIALRDRCPG
jgi:hypothetical protein